VDAEGHVRDTNKCKCYANGVKCEMLCHGKTADSLCKTMVKGNFFALVVMHMIVNTVY